MARLGFLVALLVLPTLASLAHAESAAYDCNMNWEASLASVRNPATEAEERSDLAKCLMRDHLEKPAVAQAALRIIRDAKEDLFLREDLIEAFGAAELRRTTKVEESLTPKMDKQDRDAVDRTVAGAQDILAVTQAVKSMNEVSVVTRYEADFFRVLGEIAVESGNHVVLRATAVEALEKASRKVVDSGVYDDKVLRSSQIALRTVATSGVDTSFFTGGAQAYDRLADAGTPHFYSLEPPTPAAPGRMLSSQKPATK